ncbi:DUF6691 family protein [Stenotrophomonas sp. NPDC077421]|uniref:DUF6691 family protein n=1 Tax=Stenotrophomonas sp. NPDC077421 TaxID=3414699 RepID=UPI003C2DB1C4
MSRTTLAALLSGALFGLGLAMSGMTDPRVVLGFLDFFGDFDPRLAFVLAGAVLTTVLLFRPVLRRGSSLFGIGWGAAGYCPGPALAGLGVLSVEALWFVPAMLAGMLLHRLVDRA